MAGDGYVACHGRGRVRMAGDGYVAATGKRLGEDQSFSGAFVVFRCISEILCEFCLEVMRIFVYLHTVKGVATVCSPFY